MELKKIEELVRKEIKDNYEPPDERIVKIVAKYFQLMDYSEEDIVGEYQDSLYQLYYAFQLMEAEQYITINFDRYHES